MSKVLLVDDDAMIRSFLKLHFEGHEFEVELAEDGKDALSKAAANVQDLIVLDMNMPVMTGWDAAKEPKKDGAPIIALTAVTLDESLDEFYLNGFNDIIPKPYKTEEFFHKINKYLAARETTV